MGARQCHFAQSKGEAVANVSEFRIRCGATGTIIHESKSRMVAVQRFKQIQNDPSFEWKQYLHIQRYECGSADDPGEWVRVLMSKKES